MRLPNKAISYEESILPKLLIVLQEIYKWDGISPSMLYARKKAKFLDVAEYMEVLDCCFILGAITLNEDGKIEYVNRTKL